jgi:GAF domain-containing protein
MTDQSLQAAVAAGVMAAEGEQRALLGSIVGVARAIFHAKASSVFLYDDEKDELVFEAVAGEGEQSLVGTRMPSGTGVAGWVLTTRQPLVINDTATDARFSREAAERTGYVPQSLMCAPLLHGEQALGVINVLDRPLRPGSALEEIDLLGQFAHQAALALVQLQRARRVQRVLAGETDEIQVVSRLAEALARSTPAAAGAERVALLTALANVLDGQKR